MYAFSQLLVMFENVNKFDIFKRKFHHGIITNFFIGSLLPQIFHTGKSLRNILVFIITLYKIHNI